MLPGSRWRTLAADRNPWRRIPMPRGRWARIATGTRTDATGQ
jgi:hypothetical protein